MKKRGKARRGVVWLGGAWHGTARRGEENNYLEEKPMVETIEKVKVAELVEDFGLYPRSQVDGSHVANIAHALEAGAKLPPIIIDNKSKRIIDGFHRKRAMIRVFGDAVDIDAEVRQYRDEKEMYLDALRCNAKHGKSITGSEQTGAILKAERLNITLEETAASLGITQERVSAILQKKVGTIRPSRGVKTDNRIPLKRSVSHLKTLTKDQAAAMDMLPGQPQLLLLRQLNRLIIINSMNLENPYIISEMIKLRNALNEMDLDK